MPVCSYLKRWGDTLWGGLKLQGSFFSMRYEHGEVPMCMTDRYTDWLTSRQTDDRLEYYFFITWPRSSVWSIHLLPSRGSRQCWWWWTGFSLAVTKVKKTVRTIMASVNIAMIAMINMIRVPIILTDSWQVVVSLILTVSLVWLSAHCLTVYNCHQSSWLN